MRTSRQSFPPVRQHPPSQYAVSPSGQPPYWNQQQYQPYQQQPMHPTLVPPAYQQGAQHHMYQQPLQQNIPPLHEEPFSANHYPTYGKWTKQKVADTVFTNPLHEEGYYDPYTGLKPNEPKNYANPYPKMNPIAKPKQSNVSSIMNSFKNQDGSMNMNKMMDTAGQVMSTVNQMSGMIKGVGTIFKGFGG